MSSKPVTAQSALERWRKGDLYLDDPDPGASDPDVVFYDAHRVLHFAAAEGILLETLIPDREEREKLQAHAAEHEAAEAREEAGWPPADDPPEDDGMTDEIWLLEP